MADTKQTTELRGIVTKIHYAAPHFSAGKLRPVGRTSEVSFAGKVYVREGDTVLLRGTWGNHEKFGRQFAVETLVYEDDLDADGLASWLAQHADAVGIGPAKAKKIAAEYGKDFARILKEDPEQLAVFAKLPLESVLKLSQAWLDREDENAVATKLAAWNLSRFEIEQIIKSLGTSAVNVLEQDPYLLLNVVPGLGFERVDGIAFKLGISRANPGRIQAGVVHTLKQFMSEGSTCADGPSLLAAADQLLVLDTLDATDTIKETIKVLAELGKSVKQVGEKHFALPWCLKWEQVVSGFMQAGDRPNPNCARDRAKQLAAEYCDKLNDESQQEAVAMALANRSCVITGSAGSGKTTIVKTLVKIYRDELEDSQPAGRSKPSWDNDPFTPDLDDLSDLPGTHSTVCLCAPTGKAARRLSQVVGYPSSTIHRLLEYHPKEGFRRNPDHPVSADVVIVDEASMIDSEMAYRLFRAIKPSTAVVLVGDHNQLPPVGPGAMLRDAIKHELLPVQVLNKCHRQAGALKRNCNRILEGVVEKTAPREASGWSPWIVQDRLDRPEEIFTCIERLFREVLGEKYGFRVPWDVQFMTPIHSGPLGTKAINVMLQRLHQKTLGVDVAPSSPDKPPKIYVGDKVIQTRNDYELDIMNGHQGEVLDTDPLAVDFDGRSVFIPKDRKGCIELAYCLTPHKMQGSEVPVAVTICHRLHGFMLHRGWLYTACTRAQKCSILLGDGRGIEVAGSRIVANQRKTLLGLLSEVGRNESD